MKAQGATEMQCSKWQHYLPSLMILVRVCHNSTEMKSNATDIAFCGSYIYIYIYIPVLSNVKLLSRQGLLFHGSGDDNDLIFYS